MKQFIHEKLPKDYVPSILEVGIDRGVTFIPVVVFLARTRQNFLVVGVDVKVQEQVQVMLANIDRSASQQVFCIEENSLSVMPKMVEQGTKFDVLLIDGDHNYHTVSEEMKHVEALTHAHSIVIIDDYNGRWSERDLFYSEREDYKDVTIATAKVETEKHGVKPAVDEWLASHSEWKKLKPMQGEPVMLVRG